MPVTPDHPDTPHITTAKDIKNTALAFDYGEQRIGVAVANRTAGSAKALKTLPNRDPGALDRDLRTLIEDWEPDTIVIGVPYNMDDSESRMMARAIEFATRLGEIHGLPIDQVDERLTSSEAGMMLREQRRSGQRRKKVRREDIDSLAAQLIAESWLRLE